MKNSASLAQFGVKAQPNMSFGEIIIARRMPLRDRSKTVAPDFGKNRPRSLLAMPSTPFTRTGLHLDLRIQVMPMPALRALATEVAGLGLDTLMIEWEASYPFGKHPLVANDRAYTPAELDGFLRHCSRLGLEVIPLQQCFGHIEYILRHERYAHLRESPSDLCQLCPCRAGEALDVFGDLFAELAATHPSPFLHIGGDETYLLGHCPECRAKAEKHGKSRLYVDYFKRVAEAVARLGKRPLLWADMLLKNPEAATEMPRECVFVDWNYGWEANHFGDLEKLRATGIEFWGAVAMRSHPDNHSLTCWETHFNNLRDFIPFARRSEYRGMILTSWSTSGLYGHHWDKPGEILNLLPMRRVYPISGFTVLLHAFREALDPSRPFDPKAFVIAYARDRFGLDARGGADLWRALSSDATLLEPGVKTGPVAASARRAKNIFATLRPARNHEEFAHLRLMADLREFHVRFKILEERLNSPWLTSARRSRAVRELAALLRESAELDLRFSRLNGDVLHPAELLEENEYRSKKLRVLHDRLTRQGRAAAQPSSGAGPLHVDVTTFAEPRLIPRHQEPARLLVPAISAAGG